VPSSLSAALDVSDRVRLPEIMDDPSLDAAQHYQALRGLRRINWILGTARGIWRRLKPLYREAPPRLRLLDLATGGGDVPIRLARMAERRSLPLEVSGCDVSQRAIDFARERADEAGAKVDFFPLDAIQEDLPEGYDIICCSHFLHHLSEEHALVVLGRMRERAARLALVSDLVRKRSHLLLTYAATRLLSTSNVVHVDGPLSIRAVFTMPEALLLAELAGWNGCTIRKQWPCRFLMSWKRP